MKIFLAQTAGFCMGVDMALRKLDSLLQEPDRRSEIFTLGPIIHNPQVLQDYAARGVEQINDPEQLNPGQSVVIRAHGIPRNIESALRARGVHLIDATCPKVKKAQLLIAKQAARGSLMILLGEADHPEVRGLLSYAASGAYVVDSEEELEELLQDRPGRCFLAAQTTQDQEKYARLAAILRARLDSDLPVLDTICAATMNRQSEARIIADQVQAMVVVGGRESGNTRRLVQVAEQAGIPCHHVEVAKELPLEQLRGMDRIGITAGASTPTNVIQAVCQRLETLQQSDSPAHPTEQLEAVHEPDQNPSGSRNK